MLLSTHSTIFWFQQNSVSNQIYKCVHYVYLISVSNLIHHSCCFFISGQIVSACNPLTFLVNRCPVSNLRRAGYTIYTYVTLRTPGYQLASSTKVVNKYKENRARWRLLHVRWAVCKRIINISGLFRLYCTTFRQQSVSLYVLIMAECSR